MGSSKQVRATRPTQQEDPLRGEEGLIDVRIINALYQSAKTARVVALPRQKKTVRPTIKQELRRPAVDKPPLIRVTPPSEKH